MSRPPSTVRLWPVIAALAMLLPTAARAAEPSATIDALHQGLIELAAETGLEFAARTRRLQPLLAATHDIPYIARFSLGRHWAELDAAQQQAFTTAFERLSLATYAARFRRVTPGMLETVAAEKAGGTRATVRAVIRRTDTPDVPLDYVLHATGQGWRIINIIADGVSDLALKRAEYQALLSSGGVAELMAALDRQARQLEQTALDQPTNR